MTEMQNNEVRDLQERVKQLEALAATMFGAVSAIEKMAAPLHTIRNLAAMAAFEYRNTEKRVP